MYPIPTDQLRAFCERHPIRKLSLFGSVLRDDFSPNSDVDVLVELEPGARVGYFALATMQAELTDIFGRDADLLTPNALSPYFRRDVLEGAYTVYEKRQK